ncbi:GNAT family N-acetyltransferase [Corynebacterium lizhenjunii]|uniref:GNAT family N-acetyltransferase n=1 Tax=Corynebacterium lizhenjunii TaxID=2709394 RepID=UPI0013ECBF0F|nr:GNAT family N-acetyltransferase [Corynebacterium lizhenjunii]
METTITTAPIAHLSSMDVHDMYKLRVEVFVHEQQIAYAEIDSTDAHLDTRHLLARAADGTLLGTCRIFPTTVDGEPAMQFGRFALRPCARGTGVAQQLMSHSLDLCQQQLADAPVYLNAQAPLATYYTQYGFQICGPEFDEEGLPHIPMLRRV